MLRAEHGLRRAADEGSHLFIVDDTGCAVVGLDFDAGAHRRADPCGDGTNPLIHGRAGLKRGRAVNAGDLNLAGQCVFDLAAVERPNRQDHGVLRIAHSADALL